MKQILTIVVVIFAIISLIAFTFTFNQVSNESTRLESDIQYRSSLLADGLKETVEPNFINKSDQYLQTLVERYAGGQRIAGIAVVDNTGKIIAVSSSLPRRMIQSQQIAANVMDADKADGDFVTFNGNKMYAYAQPLHDKNSVVGALLIVQNASYIDSRLAEIWTNNLIRIAMQALLITIAVLLILRWIIFIPIKNMIKSLELSRMNKRDNDKVTYNPFFAPLFKEVSQIQQSLFKARLAASEEAKAALEKLDSPWTAERLQEFTKDILTKREIFVVSNREPYIHSKKNNQISYQFPASGMVTAIEPIMQACGGTWIAHGSGSADKEVVDSNDRVKVPPYEPKYTLKRVWLSAEEEKGYYLGFSNEGLWPLCHIAHTRPIFRKEDWEMYKKVNQKFANTIHAEIKKSKNPIILIQDFHLALVPQMVKEKRKDATIGIFWHIPWPNAESFSICPWRKEIIEGMLGADLIGFHTQLHCNNFITTVGRELEAKIDLEQFSITKDNHISSVKSFPISIAFTHAEISQEEKNAEFKKSKEIVDKLGIKSKFLGVGVDRLDYTKGILERLKGIEIFFLRNPIYIGDFTFVQLCAPSRTEIKEYQNFDSRVQSEVDRINNEFKKNGWRPIVYLKEYHTHEYVYSLYRACNVCLVTSLHDGMNLVAKEFIASRDDEKGVLILSQFTGASRELHDTIIVNPYNGEETANAILEAIEMPVAEQKKRMRRMRDSIRTHNVYRWSAELLKAMVDLE